MSLQEYDGPSSRLDHEVGPCRGEANSIPDGGLVAWLQCMGSFFLLMNSFGIINSYGKWSENYEQAERLKLDRCISDFLSTESLVKRVGVKHRMDWINPGFSLNQSWYHRRPIVCSRLPLP